MRLDLALIRHHAGLSRRRARAAIEKGQVTVDGVRVREAGRQVAPSAEIVWDPNRRALPRARCALTILHEDQHLLVVDKPAGLLSVPTGPGTEEDTALGRVREYVARLRPRGDYVGRVHRLDRDTSGALAFALSREARAGLIRGLRAHSIDRAYLAVVAGAPTVDEAVVEVPLSETWKGGRRGLARMGEPGLPARTRWRVRERLAGASVLEVRLDTGRQHQIRVHLAHVGLPVLGDTVYGPEAMGRRRLPRMMLHAERLGFVHPVTGVDVAVTSPVPEDFEKVLARLRREKERSRAPD